MQTKSSILRTCAHCGATFLLPAWLARHGKGIYCGRPCQYAAAAKPLADRFWAKVNKDGPVPTHCPELGNCWPWTGTLMKKGYGQFFRGGRGGTHHLAHRQAWEIASGEAPPPDLDVLHICDHRGCVRNDEAGIYVVNGVVLPRFGHLALGTALDNSTDARLKGRIASGDRAPVKMHPESVPRGEGHWHAALTADAVRAIRFRYDQTVRKRGLIAAMAREYGVSRSLIQQLVHGRGWQHV